MKVFVTGASGHIGKLVAQDLIAAGHEVLGLAHHDAAASALDALGVEVHRGDLADLDSLRAGVRGSDGVIHLAYRHDFAHMEESAALDEAARSAMGAELDGTGKPFVIASGTLILAAGALGRTGTESDVIDANLSPNPRAGAENAVIALAERGIRSSVVRLPPTVHSVYDLHGFVPILVRTAREKGVSGYVGDGTQRWPAVHSLDAARLFRRAVESAPAGTRLHAVDDEAVPFAEIAAAIGRGLGVPTASITLDDARKQLGFLGLMAQMDNPTSSAWTRELLDWRPENVRLLADIGAGHYFAQG